MKRGERLRKRKERSSYRLSQTWKNVDVLITTTADTSAVSMLQKNSLNLS